MRCRSSSRQGVALMLVIVVLMALVVVATPFAVSMQLQEKTSRSFVHETQARFLAEGVRNYAVAHLMRTHEASEKAGAYGPPWNTPDWDTLDEFDVALDHEDLREKTGLSFLDPQGLLWSVTVRDEQSKINANYATPWVLGNLMGAGVLMEPLSEESGTVVLDDASGFYADGRSDTVDGYVWIGGEVISYRAVSGNTLSGCERGCFSDLPAFGPPAKHKAQNLVIDFRAYKISGHPVCAAPGAYTPFANLSDLKAVSQWGNYGKLTQGLCSLTPSELDRLRPSLTVHSVQAVAGAWTAPTRIHQVGGQDDPSRGDVLLVGNGRNLSPGTFLRIVKENTDGEPAVEYARVAQLQRGRNRWVVVLDRKLATLFEEEDDGYVQSQTRPPVNVNTASRAVLLALFTGVKFRWDEGRDNPETGEELRPSRCVTREEAVAVVEKIFARSAEGLPLRCHEDFQSLLLEAFHESLIEETTVHALLQNARNPHHYNLSVSTAPLCYRSSNVFSLEATGIVNLPSGKQAAMHRIEEVVEISPPREASLSLESQYDFETQKDAPQGRRIATWPNPVSVYGVYPDYDRGPDNKGHVRLESARLYQAWSQIQQVVETSGGSAMQVKVRVGRRGGGLTGYVEHFDRKLLEGFTLTPEGPDLDGAAMGFGSNVTRYVPDTQYDSRDYMAGSVEFWYRPDWESMDENHVLFDLCEDPTQLFRNRILVFYDGDNRELVFHLADATEEDTASQVRAPLTEESFRTKTWYHVAASWKGSRVGELALLLDGRPVGRFVHRTASGSERITVLTQDMDEETAEIAVESTDGFPEAGVLLIGYEAVTYTAKTPTSFVYQPYPEFVPPEEPAAGGAGTPGSSGCHDPRAGRSYAQPPSAPDRQEAGTEPAVQEAPQTGTYNVKTNRGKRGTEFQSHPAGSTVSVFGYVTDLSTRIPVGGAELVSEGLGPDTRTRVMFPGEQRDEDTGGAGGPGGPGGMPKHYQAGVPKSVSITLLTADADEIELKDGEDFPDRGFVILGWRKGSSSAGGAASGTAGAAGLAGGPDYQDAGEEDAGSSSGIQHEIVYYAEKDEHTLKKVQRGQLGTSAQEFSVSWTPGSAPDFTPLQVWLISVAASSTENYLDEGRLQIDDEWFLYDAKEEMDGQHYFVRTDVVEDIEKHLADAEEVEVDEDTGEVQEDGEEEEVPQIKFRAAHRTVGAEHAKGALILPVFEVEDECMGRFDDVTFLSKIAEAETFESGRVNWADGTYAALTENVSSEVLPLITRVLKFPSGETPSRLGDHAYVGGSTPGASGVSAVTTRGRIDEVRFTTAHRGIFRLENDLTADGDEVAIRVHPLPGRDDPGDLPLNLPSDGGILRIADEYIGFTEVDGNGVRNLKRGMLGSEPASHSAGAFVMHMAFLSVSTLGEELSSEGNTLNVGECSDFPNNGYVLLGDEVIGYTRVRPRARQLVVASVTPEAPGAFRGAFGTTAASHPAGELLVLLPHRYHDRYRPELDVPEMAYFQASFSARDALWQEVAWEEHIPDPTAQDVVVLVRVDGIGRWDEPPTNRAGGIHRFDDPEAANIVGVQGDFIEVRVCFPYRKGAFDGNGWKASPEVRSLKVRYAQPLKVLSHKELGNR